MKKAKKIFVGNYKGGVGKTTSVYQIGRHLVLNGKKVLLIDLDPQCSLSEICIGNLSELDQLKSNESLNYVYDMWIQLKSYPNIECQFDKKVLVKTNVIGLDYIPSNIFYKSGGLDELAMNLKNDLEDLIVLQQFMQKHRLEYEYDYILFDCPPSNNVITQGAFLISDYYLIPTILQTMSARGVAHYITTIERIYKKYCVDHNNSDIARLLFGEKPKLLGIFETLKKGSVKNDDVLIKINTYIKDANVESQLSIKGKDKYIFSTIINNYEDIARDTANGKIREEYKDLTKEIMECID
ncbi:ParA family protein [Clostridium psychrophilum]|uniref:ParA family protein n=1 Tax=Clostridium psychrophilum TaxID=132926 RepID=UPI001C0C20D1|nr:AAA family ATPase [Clostridium psychrophilum]MBU3181172.1 AAA family ATPase [Clostridium psychrophilum]